MRVPGDERATPGAGDPAPIVLRDGRARVGIDPALGAGLASYDFDGRPVLRPRDREAPEPVLGLAMNLLAPWSNRVSGGGFAWEGEFHALEPNLAGEPCPIHGDAWQSAWTPREVGPARAVLTLASDGPGPFAYEAQVSHALDGGALTTRLTVTSRAGRTLPFGLGFHPWLPRGEGTRLQAAASRVQLQDERYLPTDTVSLGEHPEWDFRASRPLPRAWVNNAFEGWDGRALIEQPELGLDVEIRAPGLDVFVLYAPSPEAEFFCFEPVSHAVDEHNAARSPRLRPLAPGETTAAEMTITPRRRDEA